MTTKTNATTYASLNPDVASMYPGLLQRDDLLAAFRDNLIEIAKREFKITATRLQNDASLTEDAREDAIQEERVKLGMTEDTLMSIWCFSQLWEYLAKEGWEASDVLYHLMLLLLGSDTKFSDLHTAPQWDKA